MLNHGLLVYCMSHAATNAVSPVYIGLAVSYEIRDDSSVVEKSLFPIISITFDC